MDLYKSIVALIGYREAVQKEESKTFIKLYSQLATDWWRIYL